MAGIAEVSRTGYPDFTAWDPKDVHYDPASTKEKPVWFMVDVKFKRKFAEVVPLDALKRDGRLKGLMVTRRGARLSVQPVSKSHFERVAAMGKAR